MLFHKQMMAGLLLLVAVVFLLIPAPGHAEPFDHEHATWNLVPKSNVHWDLNRTASQVNYAGFQKTHDLASGFL